MAGLAATVVALAVRRLRRRRSPPVRHPGPGRPAPRRLPAAMYVVQILRYWPSSSPAVADEGVRRLQPRRSWWRWAVLGVPR
ncbi:hypothetical protein [Actinoplanes nipponensis]|uniref:hypothetical protein n=1 Tax=Actinoplanes nipponensis TaxID=135950 RepID=UPI0031E79D6C